MTFYGFGSPTYLTSKSRRNPKSKMSFSNNDKTHNQ